MLQQFNHDQFGAIRVLADVDGPLWRASDLCTALGYANPRDAVARHVDEEDVVKRDTPTSGGIQSLTYLNESGLYALILGSKLPSAKVFKRWVTGEVLPAIRQHGQYGMPANLPNFASPVEAARAWADQLELREQAEAKVALLAPKAAVVERIVEAGNTKNLTEAAKIMALSPKAFIDRLLADKVLYRTRTDGGLLPYQEQIDKGRFVVKTGEQNGHAYTQTRVTMQGVAWLTARYYGEVAA